MILLLSTCKFIIIITVIIIIYHLHHQYHLHLLHHTFSFYFQARRDLTLSNGTDETDECLPKSRVSLSINMSNKICVTLYVT